MPTPISILFRSSPPARRRGLALFLTLVTLVVLTGLVYGLVSRISLVRHRQQYMIDYQNARYACDSGMKYAMTTLNTIQLRLINRKDEPDFSDIFIKDKTEYDQYLADWAVYKAQLEMQKAAEEGTDAGAKSSSSGFDKDLFKGLTNLVKTGTSTKDPNSLGSDPAAETADLMTMADPNSAHDTGAVRPGVAADHRTDRI